MPGSVLSLCLLIWLPHHSIKQPVWSLANRWDGHFSLQPPLSSMINWRVHRCRYTLSCFTGQQACAFFLQALAEKVFFAVRAHGHGNVWMLNQCGMLLGVGGGVLDQTSCNNPRADPDSKQNIPSGTGPSPSSTWANMDLSLSCLLLKHCQP